MREDLRGAPALPCQPVRAPLRHPEPVAEARAEEPELLVGGPGVGGDRGARPRSGPSGDEAPGALRIIQKAPPCGPGTERRALASMRCASDREGSHAGRAPYLSRPADAALSRRARPRPDRGSRRRAPRPRRRRRPGREPERRSSPGPRSSRSTVAPSRPRPRPSSTESLDGRVRADPDPGPTTTTGPSARSGRRRSPGTRTGWVRRLARHASRRAGRRAPAGTSRASRGPASTPARGSRTPGARRRSGREDLALDRDVRAAPIHGSSALGVSTYVPALMSPGTSSAGFSRNSSTRPSGPVGTRPNGRASSTCVSAIVAAAPRVAVELDHRRQVEVGEDVAVQREERLVAVTPRTAERVHDRAAGAERRLLGDPRDLRVALTRLDERAELLLEVRAADDTTSCTS